MLETEQGMLAPLAELDLDHFYLRQRSCVFERIDTKVTVTITAAEVAGANIPHNVPPEKPTGYSHAAGEKLRIGGWAEA